MEASVAAIVSATGDFQTTIPTITYPDVLTIANYSGLGFGGVIAMDEWQDITSGFYEEMRTATGIK